MTGKKTLRALIEEHGSTKFGRLVARHPSYMSRVKKGVTPGSVELLGRALGVYGPELDVEASIRELVPDEVEAGAAARQDGEREGDDHAQA